MLCLHSKIISLFYLMLPFFVRYLGPNKPDDVYFFLLLWQDAGHTFPNCLDAYGFFKAFCREEEKIERYGGALINENLDKVLLVQVSFILSFIFATNYVLIDFNTEKFIFCIVT